MSARTNKVLGTSRLLDVLRVRDFQRRKCGRRLGPANSHAAAGRRRAGDGGGARVGDGGREAVIGAVDVVKDAAQRLLRLRRQRHLCLGRQCGTTGQPSAQRSKQQERAQILSGTSRGTEEYRRDVGGPVEARGHGRDLLCAGLAARRLLEDQPEGQQPPQPCATTPSLRE